MAQTVSAASAQISFSNVHSKLPPRGADTSSAGDTRPYALRRGRRVVGGGASQLISLGPTYLINICIRLYLIRVAHPLYCMRSSPCLPRCGRPRSFRLPAPRPESIMRSICLAITICFISHSPNLFPSASLSFGGSRNGRNWHCLQYSELC